MAFEFIHDLYFCICGLVKTLEASPIQTISFFLKQNHLANLIIYGPAPVCFVINTLMVRELIMLTLLTDFP